MTYDVVTKKGLRRQIPSMRLGPTSLEVEAASSLTPASGDRGHKHRCRRWSDKMGLMGGRRMKLVGSAVGIVALPFIWTGAVILGGHFAHSTITVNWAWCAATGVGLSVAWLVKRSRGGHRTP